MGSVKSFIRHHFRHFNPAPHRPRAGLDDGPNTCFRMPVPHRAQRLGDRRGMMGEIVEELDAGRLATQLQPAPHPFEGRQPIRDLAGAEPLVVCGGDDGQSIADVVRASHLQRHLGVGLGVTQDAKTRAVRRSADLLRQPAPGIPL